MNFVPPPNVYGVIVKIRDDGAQIVKSTDGQFIDVARECACKNATVGEKVRLEPNLFWVGYTCYRINERPNDPPVSTH